jgi:protocatechuate 3,4-dioxygenase beta subunit
MTLETDKLKSLTTISATAVITILYLTLLLTYVTFLNLSQTSLAQTTNTNQTSTGFQSQPKASTIPCKLTESAAKGGEYKTGAPFKQGQDFAKGLQGQGIELSGRVLNLAGCKPIEGAVLELWQTNSRGDYDNKGFNLRGKIVTDKDGKYLLDTISPGRYHLEGNTTRPSHIHVMVGVPGQPIINTQLYFDVQPTDFDMDVKDILIPKLITDANRTKIMKFDFVIEDYR